MFRLLSIVVIALATYTKVGVHATVTLCRNVCPPGPGTVSENLFTDRACSCEYFNAAGPCQTSYDQSGNLEQAIGSGCNSQVSPRAITFCATVADGWMLANAQVCYVDKVNPRVLTEDMMVPLDANTPAACTAKCNELGFSFAGVEFGSECHCGNGFNFDPVTGISSVPFTNCNMPCTGDANQTCGSGGFMQIFQGPFIGPPAAQLPSTWNRILDIPCAQDTPAHTLFTNTLIAGAALAATDSPAACVGFCDQRGFRFAGLEGGDECYCGTGFSRSIVGLDRESCNLPCQGAPGLKCGGVLAIQLYSKN
ncbi:hypothetical protein BXZ70DRAFT_922739 [Cristinia sonorae]|uniref:WSC domain-containing protein n=1 Tax=Cristinia sonorae TaxID=1940300 RepID=A0A8K0XTN8_9AGAR|nr:hypothetical protein BXZ70DRAFT_922739 [Cristinia sonorae]